ncbi:MAG: hypothetical protein U0840_09330 [Gemmataceae bacterium]
MLWVTLALGLLLGAFFGGWHSIRLARQGDRDGAERSLHRGALVAALGGAVLTVPTLGWPFMAATVSVPEEVIRTVTETVLVPVEVTRWFFFKGTEWEATEVKRQVREATLRNEKRQEFSGWLLLAMASVGGLCFWLKKQAVRLVWCLFG